MNKDANKASIERVLHRAITEMKLSKAEFARQIGVTGQRLNNWIIREKIPGDNLPMISGIIGKSLDWIYAGDYTKGTLQPTKSDTTCEGDCGELNKNEMIGRIRSEMKSKSVTPAILAENANVTVQAVNQWLSSGKIGLDKFLIISKLLSRSIDWILTGHEEPVFLNGLQKNYYQLDDSWQKKVDELIRAGLDAQQPKSNLILYQHGLERVLMAIGDEDATPAEILFYTKKVYEDALEAGYTDSVSNVVEFNQFADKTIKRLIA